MSVAYDAASESHTGTTGNTGTPNPFTWTHTPSGTPRAAVVFVFTIASATQASSVSYGGTAMSAVSYVGFDSDTEPGGCQAWFLDNVASGNQTVSVSRSGTSIMYAVCFTVTAAAPCVIGPNVYTQGGASANTNASTTATGTGACGVISVDDGTPATASQRFMGQYYGGAAPLGAGTGSTAGPSIDLGAYACGTYYETTPGTGARNVGSAAGTDDRGVVALSVKEITSTTASAGEAASTGTAQVPTAVLHGFGPVASATGTAHQPSAYGGMTASAGAAASTGTALSPGTQVLFAGGLASATGTAPTAVPVVTAIVGP